MHVSATSQYATAAGRQIVPDGASLQSARQHEDGAPLAGPWSHSSPGWRMPSPHVATGHDGTNCTVTAYVPVVSDGSKTRIVIGPPGDGKGGESHWPRQNLDPFDSVRGAPSGPCSSYVGTKSTSPLTSLIVMLAC